ncbi:MAG: hypothetical protein ABIR63_04490 [Sphingomicrobium sp.]
MGKLRLAMKVGGAAVGPAWAGAIADANKAAQMAVAKRIEKVIKTTNQAVKSL